MRTTWCVEERPSSNMKKYVAFSFCCSQERLNVLLSLFSHQSSTGKVNCSTSIPFCSISYKGYCILHWKILKNLSLRETSVYLWYSHIKGSYFFLKVRILHLWLYLNKQTILKGGGGREKVIYGWINIRPLHCSITPLREGMQISKLQFYNKSTEFKKLVTPLVFLLLKSYYCC